MTEQDLKADLINRLTVPLWPHAGTVLGLSRNSTYESAKRGDIPVIKMGKLKKVSTSWLRRTVGLETSEYARLPTPDVKHGVAA